MVKTFTQSFSFVINFMLKKNFFFYFTFIVYDKKSFDFRHGIELQSYFLRHYNNKNISIFKKFISWLDFYNELLFYFLLNSHDNLYIRIFCTNIHVFKFAFKLFFICFDFSYYFF